MNQRWFILVAVVCMIAALLLPACAKPAPAPAIPKAEPIVLSWVSYSPGHIPKIQIAKRQWDEIQERSKGELLFNYVGGPETIGIFEQGKAVKEGVVDMSHVFSEAYTTLVPEAPLQLLSLKTPQEERAAGAHDLLAELHKKAGLFYLGRADVYGKGEFLFRIYLSKKGVTTPGELKGLQIGKERPTEKWLENFGAVNISVARTDAYVALERGMVDGFVDSIDDVYPKGLHEVLRYAIDHPYHSTDVVTIINPDKWNSLPKHLQDLMLEVQLEMEVKKAEWGKAARAEQRQLLEKAGMEFIKLSPADEATWYKAIHDYFSAFYLKPTRPAGYDTQSYLDLLKKMETK